MKIINNITSSSSGSAATVYIDNCDNLSFENLLIVNNGEHNNFNGIDISSSCNNININSIKWGKLKIYKKHSRLVKFLGLYYIYGEIYKY